MGVGPYVSFFSSCSVCPNFQQRLSRLETLVVLFGNPGPPWAADASHDADDAPQRDDDTAARPGEHTDTPLDDPSLHGSTSPVRTRGVLSTEQRVKKKRHDVDRVDVSFCWPMRVRRASRDARAASVPTGCRRGVRQGKRRWTPWRTGVSDAATGGTVHAANRSG